MKRFAVLPLLLFVFACGDTTTAPAVDDALPTFTAFEANPDSEGATFSYDPEIGTGILVVNPDLCVAYLFDVRQRYHKASGASFWKGNGITLEGTVDGMDLEGTGNAHIIFNSEMSNWHFVGEVEDGSGNRYNLECKYLYEYGAVQESYIVATPK